MILKMKQFSFLQLMLAILIGAEARDAYTDENRPYEFGFNIEGEQHRHESKDANGIIMGEFGFLTADGVYHVTVYATDENGNFKILSMKNIRVKPYPTVATTTLPPPPPPPPVPIRLPASVQQPIVACSSCSIPSTSESYTQINQEQSLSNPPFNQLQSLDSPFSGQAQPLEQFPQPLLPQGELPTYNQFTSVNDGGSPNPNYNLEQYRDPSELSNLNNGFNPEYESVPIGPATPVLISAEMSYVDNPAEVFATGPGYQSGLPAGLSEADMLKLLYTFNYTLGFHGHHEDGYLNGDKKGEYFVNNRDGTQTKVEYVANEFGYQPKITIVQLGLDSPDTPKEETEKDEKYGLKGYEFKWLYFPK